MGLNKISAILFAISSAAWIFAAFCFAIDGNTGRVAVDLVLGFVTGAAAWFTWNQDF